MAAVSTAFRKTEGGSLIQKERKRPPRITAKMRQVLDLLATGECDTQKEACERVGMAQSHVSKQLQREHVQSYLALAAKHKLSSALLNAAHVKVKLLKAVSEKVQNDVASEILAMGGIQAPKQGNNTNVNVSVSAGYVINLAHEMNKAPTIEGTVAHDVDAT